MGNYKGTKARSGYFTIKAALFFLQRIMIGYELDQNMIDYIDVDASGAEINAEFKLFGKDLLFEVGYHICFIKKDGEINIDREYLNCAINQGGARTNKNIFMDYQRSEIDAIFKPQKRFLKIMQL